MHTRIDRPLASREPLQFGAEIFGHAGLEADLEVLELALACLGSPGVRGMQLDLADVRVIDAVLAPAALDPSSTQRIHAALAIKDVAALEALSSDLPERVRQDLLALPRLFGGVEVLSQARAQLQASPLLHAALDNLGWLVGQLGAGHDVSIDLADLRGYAYYTGMRFAVFAPGRRVASPRSWHAVAATTRWARSLDASVRRWGSASISRNWWRRSRHARFARCDPRALGHGRRPCAQPSPRCAPRGTPWFAPCRATNRKSTNSAAIASWCRIRHLGVDSEVSLNGKIR